MSEPVFSRIFALKAMGRLIIGAMLLVSVSSCDLAKNELKIDRSGDMETQDYRDALAPRLPQLKADSAGDAGIPELKPYMATPSDKLKPMPLVSISVNQSVPLKDVLYELSEQAGYDLELDPRIKGSIIFTARNKPFDQVIDRLAANSGLRYKFDGDSVRVELDTPYNQIYSVNYLSYVRSNSSSISNDVAVVSGEGADTGSKFKAEATSEADFWGELNVNLTQMLGVNRNAGSLITKKDPKITAVAETPPVEPVLLSANGEIAQRGTNPDGSPAAVATQVKPPEAVLRVEPLPIDEEEEDASTANEDPYMPRFSINKQAGIISVFANERLQKQVREYMDALRKSSTAQVLIEAKVLEISLNDEFAAGVDWSSVGLFRNRLNFGVDTVGQALAPVFDTPSDPSLSFIAGYQSGDFNAAIQAMQRFGTVHALASPRLTVLNNQSAVLNVAKNQVYFEIKVESETTDNGRNTDVTSTIRNVPEGVLINVQPSIDLDNQTISMAVRPTVTRISEFVNDPGIAYVVAEAGLSDSLASPVPVVNIQEFDSVIQLNNKQAIVMGGLIQDRTSSTQNAVPVLGEIPIVGGLFRNQGDSVQKTELVVLMKATIVEGNNTVHQTDKDLYRAFSQDRRPFDL